MLLDIVKIQLPLSLHQHKDVFGWWEETDAVFAAAHSVNHQATGTWNIKHSLYSHLSLITAASFYKDSCEPTAFYLSASVLRPSVGLVLLIFVDSQNFKLFPEL